MTENIKSITRLRHPPSFIAYGMVRIPIPHNILVPSQKTDFVSQHNEDNCA